MSKIDFSKAPAGATHYTDTWLDGMNALWYKEVEGGYQYFSFQSGVWEKSGNNNSWFSEHLKEIVSGEFQPFTSIEDARPATAKQPAPNGSGNPILGMVLADLTNRALEGKEKYGEPLKAHNGRNALWDAYQEALDLAMYLRQAIEEQSK